MIGKVSGKYDSKFSGYNKDPKAGKIGPCSTSSKLGTRITYGFVELIGRVDPRPIKGTDPEPFVTDSQPASAAGGTSAANKAKVKMSKEPEFIYEYSWSAAAEGDNAGWFWELDNTDAIVVQLIFHTSNSRFHVSEVSASLKQVPPYCKTKSQEFLDWVEMLTPFADIAGKAMQAGGLAAPGKVISSISKMKLNSVPANKFPWYVKTFSVNGEPGIEWHIPNSLVNQTGNRLSGSVGVTFTDGGGADSDAEDSLKMEVKAFLRADDGELFLSPTNSVLALIIKPA